MSSSRTQDLMARRDTDSTGESAVWQNLTALSDTLAQVLPKHLGADRFVRLAFTEMRRTPKLMDCDWKSVAGSLMVCAQLGLEPGGPLGHAWLIPYKRECTVQIGYRGYIDLARRSGQILSLSAHAVHEADEFTYAYGLAERLEHRPALRGDRGPAYAYYAVARYADGGHNLVVLSRDDVDSYRARSQAGGKGPWVTDYDAMARKTAVRRLVPFLPLASEVQAALRADDGTAEIVDGRAEAVARDTSVPAVTHPHTPEDAPVAVTEGVEPARPPTVVSEPDVVVSEPSEPPGWDTVDPDAG